MRKSLIQEQSKMADAKYMICLELQIFQNILQQTFETLEIEGKLFDSHETWKTNFWDTEIISAVRMKELYLKSNHRNGITTFDLVSGLDSYREFLLIRNICLIVKLLHFQNLKRFSVEFVVCLKEIGKNEQK